MPRPGRRWGRLSGRARGQPPGVISPRDPDRPAMWKSRAATSPGFAFNPVNGGGLCGGAGAVPAVYPSVIARLGAFDRRGPGLTR